MNLTELKQLIREEVQQLQEGSFGSIYDMKAQIKDGTFNPDDPEVLINGWGRLSLKGVERWIAKDLAELSKRATSGGDHNIKNIDTSLFSKYAPLMHKIKAAHEVYEQMNTSQYKRAVTMYKRRKK